MGELLLSEVEETIEKMAVHFMKIGWKNVSKDHLEYYNALISELSSKKTEGRPKSVQDAYFRLDGKN